MTTAGGDLAKRLSLLKREILARGFDRHPSILNIISDLPSELQSPVVKNFSTTEDIRKIIFFPQQIQRGWCYVPKQALIFTKSDVIHLLASIWPGEEPQVTRLSSPDLIYLKADLILLYGFLEIAAKGQDSPVRLGVEFNAVYWDLFAPFLRNLLKTQDVAPPSPEEGFASSPSLQEQIDGLPLKFTNGLRIHGMLPGENLEELVFQASTWKRRLLFFRKQITADTLILLTKNFMVILQEEVGVKQGWIVAYLRRACISEIRGQDFDAWSELTIELKREEQKVDYKLLLPVEAARVWRERWVRHEGLWRDVIIAEG